MRPADFVDPFKGRPGVFHLASDHLETIRLFSDRESFCYGVNTLALAVARFGIRLFCYELMDSHLHVLSGGTWTKCREFFRWVLHRLAMMISARDVGLVHGYGGDPAVVEDARKCAAAL